MKTKSQAAQAAQIIRKWLKNEGVAARVTSDSYAGGNSVNVDTCDLSPVEAKRIMTYLNQFQYGNYDGMNECYNYTNVNTDIPQVKFVFLNNSHSHSHATRQRAWEWLKSRYAGYFNNAPDSVDYAHQFFVKEVNLRANIFLHQEMSRESSAFWAA